MFGVSSAPVLHVSMWLVAVYNMALAESHGQVI